MKIFALFLPQFHEIPENNKWWGEGFTEWTKVKNSKPLFKGHKQPRVPLNDNYYNLLNRKTVEFQTQLMQSYGVDGLIYYHYYFKGKLLLERPAENLLLWKEINQPFFFCWANHSWYKATKNKKELLIKMEYGNQEDWEQHFQYLLPFFKDKRYEKKGNMPLFMIFDNHFAEKLAMFDYFDRRCRESGFDGICIVETIGCLPDKNMKQSICKQTQYINLREPNTSAYLFRHKAKFLFSNLTRKLQRLLIKCGSKRYVNKYDGNKLYNIMIKDEPHNDSMLAHGVFFEWDNTPRHENRGFIITPPDKQKFFKYMDSIQNDDFVIVNAWNEWAEGMMLEPTQDEGYKYLEWIKEWKSI